MTKLMNLGAKFAQVAFATAILAVTSSSAAAETPAAAQGWQALIGCWEPVAPLGAALPDSARSHIVCVLPVEGSTSLDFVTVVNGQATERERVDASGTRQPLTRDDCSGWQSAEWSAAGHRLFLHSELTCSGGLKRTSTGVISMPTTSEWVDVQAVSVGAQKSVRTLRYRETNRYAMIPAAETAALAGRQFSVGVNTARLAAATPVSADELVAVARRLDAAAVEGWLAQQRIGFRADARQLVSLADAGLPERVIDVIVGLSYPDRFTVAAAGPAVNDELLRSADRPYGTRGGGYYDPFWDPFYGSRRNRGYYSPYGYSGYGAYGYGGPGYGYGYNWYPSRPVVVIVTPDSSASAGGKVVKGRGYTRRPDQSPAPDRRRAPEASSGSSGSSSSGSSAGSSSGGSSSGGSSSGERTAKRRPPG